MGAAFAVPHSLCKKEMNKHEQFVRPHFLFCGLLACTYILEEMKREGKEVKLVNRKLAAAVLARQVLQ
ncbi:hypothetical protein SRHO_G00211900 [Serrasalmus rhombeus]